MINKTVKIAHLYPNELNLYGDGGNVLCLYNRLLWRGFNPEIINVEIGDKLRDFDILFIGGAQDREMEIIKADLKRKSTALSYYIKLGKSVLAICGGYQLLGEYYQTKDGEKIQLSGALPFYTIGYDKRMIGNIVFDTPFGKVVGFENHSGKTYLSNSLSPLGNVISGFGNNGEDKTEGLHFKNIICTYAHGPVLPKNPALADAIISSAINEDLTPLDDKIENSCHSYLISRFT